MTDDPPPKKNGRRSRNPDDGWNPNQRVPLHCRGGFSTTTLTPTGHRRISAAYETEAQVMTEEFPASPQAHAAQAAIHA